MEMLPLLIGRRKRGLRSFSSRLDTACFLGSAVTWGAQSGLQPVKMGMRSGCLPRKRSWEIDPNETTRPCDSSHRDARLSPVSGFGPAEDALYRRLRRLLREDDPRRGDPSL